MIIGRLDHNEGWIWGNKQYQIDRMNRHHVITKFTIEIKLLTLKLFQNEVLDTFDHLWMTHG